MLGFETEKRLKSFLDVIKDGESYQEIKRQRLCSIRDFAPYSAFMRLDRDANKSISSREVLNFLRDNREYTFSEKDCLLLIKYFDSDNDDRLTFQEYFILLHLKFIDSNKFSYLVKTIISGNKL